MASCNFFLFITLFAFGFAASAKNHLANLVPLCDEKSPKFNGCVAAAANKLIPQLSSGIRELDFPPMDPLRIPRMDIGQEKGTVYLKLELSNTVHTGFSNLHINHAHMDMEGLVWTLNGTLPRYSLTGDYVGKGRILLLPLGGEGISNFTFEDLKISMIIRGSKKMMSSQEHLNVKEVQVLFDFAPGKNYLDIHRLKGDLTLADHTRNFLRENADEVFSNMKITFEEVYTDIFTGILRRVFNKVPYKQLFKH